MRKHEQRNEIRKILAIILMVAMVSGMMPGTLLTAQAAEEAVSYISRSWNSETRKVVDEEKTCSDYTFLKSDSTAWGSADEGVAWYVVSSNVTIGSRITVTGTANLILCDGCTLTASSGITVEEGNTLNLYGQSEETGSLKTTGTSYNAGIGGEKNNTAGTITIYGGNITATQNNKYGAAIGGGMTGNGGEVTIYGGTVNAETLGNLTGAGIGGGSTNGNTGGSGGTFSLYGGIVIAKSKNTGAGIGGGSGATAGGDGAEVLIEGGEVTAYGGEFYSKCGSGAGIGGGGSWSGTSKDASAGSGGTVTINGGIVTAIGAKGGGSYTCSPGIGGGCCEGSSTSSHSYKGGDGGTVTVNGGTLDISASYNGYGVAIGGGSGCGKDTTVGGTGGSLNVNGGKVYLKTDGRGFSGGLDHYTDAEKPYTYNGIGILTTSNCIFYAGDTESPESDDNNIKTADDYASTRWPYMTFLTHYSGEKAASAELRSAAGSTVEVELPTIPDDSEYGTITNNNTDLFTVSDVSDGKVTVTTAKNLDPDTESDPKTFTVSVNCISYADYDITVTITPVFKDAQTITASDVSATYGDTGKKVSAIVTTPSSGAGAISYSVKSGSEDYIDVAASTGALTIKKAGTAYVVARAAETRT